MRRTSSLTALALALVLPACGSGSSGPAGGSPTPGTPSPTPTRTSSPSPSASPSPSPAASPALGATCRAEAYEVAHPADWSTNSTGDPCRWFHPEPFTLPQAQEVTGLAVALRFAPRGFEDMVGAVDDGLEEVLDREEREVRGRPAVRWELRASGQALLPEGTRSTQWLVDAGPLALLATTSEAADAGTYARNVEVLDAMVASLQLDEEGAPCSASGLPTSLPEQQALPEEVARTRQALYRAAVQCDPQALADLAPERGFTYSFGDDGDPAAFWSAAEQHGDEPLRSLARVLRLPPKQQQAGGDVLWAWPEAHAYDSWSEVPERARQDLRVLYDEQDLQDFARFGAYIGYRVVIDADGTWRAFVAGD